MARYHIDDEWLAQLKKLTDLIEASGMVEGRGRCEIIAGELLCAGVALRAEGGAECPICHGTGRIGTTDWLTKHLSEKQLAEEKSKAIAEHEQHIKAEVAREIFEEIEKSVVLKMPAKITPIFKRDLDYSYGVADGKRDALLEVLVLIAELKKKHTECEKNG